MFLPSSVRKLIELAIEEDLGRGDLSASAVPRETKATAKVIAKESLCFSGRDLVAVIIQSAGLESELEIKWNQKSDGDLLETGQTIFELKGNARSILGLERTILNFLQRMCGVASLAHEYKKLLGESNVRILDTRKTIPAWRFLDKQAVRDGGLWNHRFALDSGILIKENHIRAAGSLKNVVTAIRAEQPHLIKVQVEVESLAEAREAVELGIEALLLDNFSASDLSNICKELRALKTSLVLEASGGIHLGNINEYINSGVDQISVGALTHSAPSADLSMLFDFS